MHVAAAEFTACLSRSHPQHGRLRYCRRRRSLPWCPQLRWRRQSARARRTGARQSQRPLPPRYTRSTRARARRRCIRNACRPAPAPAAPPAFTAAAAAFAIMCFVKSNVSRQSGVRKSSNACQFSSIIHARKHLRQVKNVALKHPALFVRLLKNDHCEQPL